MIVYVVAVLCVVGIAAGQVLFKISSMVLAETGTFMSVKTLLAFAPAMLCSGLSSFAWVWLLQLSDLGLVYSLLALAFVLVPLGSHLAFGERFQVQLFVGVALIMAFINIAAKAWPSLIASKAEPSA